MMKMSLKQRLVNYYYFVIFISLIFMLIGVIYWIPLSGTVNYFISPNINNLLEIAFIITHHIIILTLFTIVIAIVNLPTIYLQGKTRILWQSIFMSIAILLLFTDIGLFHSYGLHIFNADFACIKQLATNCIFTNKRIIAYFGFLCLLVTIFFVNHYINKTKFFTYYKIGKKYIFIILTLVLVNSLIYLSSSQQKKQLLSIYTQRLQFFLQNNSIEQHLCYINRKIRNSEPIYPLQTLQTKQVNNPPNILIIAMDAWRADCFNKDDSPNLWQFAQQGKIFTNHFSGGNHTYAGLFSLFYGINANYFSKFQQKKTPALLFSRLKQLDYQINCFADSSIYEWLKFFTNINSLNKLNKNITRQYKKDQVLTNDWIDWYHGLNKTKPWFSFVFYDSLHGPDFPDNYSLSSKPAIKFSYKGFAKKYGKANFIASYKTAVHYIDSLASKILQQLKDNNELENTIVIITADHGLEWDDNNQSYYGYRSNFTNCQVQVPLAIIYPNSTSLNQLTIENSLTTHYDIVPTLMQNFLGVTNDVSDYNIGINLIHNYKVRDFALLTSIGRNAVNNGIIKQNKQLIISPSGLYNLRDSLNRILLNKINIDYINQALEYMTHFIKK